MRCVTEVWNVPAIPGNIQTTKPPADEPVFNTFKRKPLRPFYFLREFQIGLVILLILAAVLGWVMWRGANPDPSLFKTDDALLATKGATIPIYKRPVAPWVEPGSQPAGAPAGNGAGGLGTFPSSVVSEGWRVTAPPQEFDESNLYSKIDGRETFYKSYGFKRLHFLSLVSTAQDQLGIDIELFDLGSIDNALGALAAEISNPQQAVNLDQTGLWYASVNSGFLARGRFYARMIGSDDSDVIRQKIQLLKDALATSLAAEPIPWAYALFVGQMRLNPGVIRFDRENAFSLDFADEFYTATLPGVETEIFVSRRTDAGEAKALAGKLADGFASYGKRLPSPDGTVLIQNEFINTIEAVRSFENLVIGVRLAPSTDDALRRLDTLQQQLAAMKKSE